MAGKGNPVRTLSSHERFPLDYTGDRRGPCLVVLAGLHGDEVGGVRAVERVRDALREHSPTFRGRVVGVFGNLAAIARGVRYVDRDLNREWYDETIKLLLEQDPEDDDSEDREQRELLAFIDSLQDEPNTPIVFLDLHSTSAEGLPFLCMPDTLNNLRLALELPVPSILGLEETIRGPMLGMLSDLGYAGVIVEGGQHDHPATVDILESCIWVLLERLRCIHRRDVPNYGEHYRRLARAGRDLPRVLDIRHRHETRHDDGFEMKPGYEHYDRVAKREVLATDKNGVIHSPMRARIIMPAYKPGTDQGFFLARDVPWIYVKTLFLVRWLRFGDLAHLLPGTARHSVGPNFLTVASWVPERLVKVIRLLGWRRMFHDERQTILRRRLVHPVSRVRHDR